MDIQAPFIIVLFYSIQTASGAQKPPIKWVPQNLFTAALHEADHSPSWSPQIKNARTYTSIPLYIFAGAYWGTGTTISFTLTLL
jgi:hypothetical protein